MNNTYLLFELNHFNFGVSIKDVLHVLRNSTLITLPKSHEALIGIVEYNEKKIPVIDLRKDFMWKQESPKKNLPWIILIQLEAYPDLPFGIFVDKAIGLFTFSQEMIDESEKKYPEWLRSELISEIVTYEAKTILILQIESIMKKNHLIED